jgi:hypothetical protein
MTTAAIATTALLTTDLRNVALTGLVAGTGWTTSSGSLQGRGNKTPCGSIDDNGEVYLILSRCETITQHDQLQ